MEVIYRANDGTIFDNEVYCRNYEIRLKIITSIKKNELRFLRKSLEEITWQEFELADTNSELFALFDSAFYFYCDNDEILNFINPYFLAEDCESGVFYHYNDENAWINLQEEIKDYQESLNRSETALSLLKIGKVTK